MRRYPLFVILIILAFVGLAGDKAQAQGGQPDAGAFDTAPEVSSAPAAALGTAFTYQGQLKSGGTPYNGACDFQFKLYDASSAGAQIGATQTASNVSVSSGVFTTPIDFGAGAFDGNARWLDISAHCPAGRRGRPRRMRSRCPVSTRSKTRPVRISSADTATIA